MKFKTLLRTVLVAVPLTLSAVGPVVAGTVTVRGFEGTSQLDNCALGECFRPPDTMGAVGTTQFMETSNGSVTIYNKATGAVESRVNMRTFWAAAGQPGGAEGDQRVLFDHYTNRWIAVGFGATGNVINIGVSETSNALGPWKSTAVTALPSTSSTADYPTLGMDSKGVYIATNNFTPDFAGTSLFVIPKTSLFGGAPSTTNMTTFNTPLAEVDRGFAIQAAVKWDGNASNSASVIADSRDFYHHVFYKINGVDGPGATQTASTVIAGSEYAGEANAARQPDGTRTVDTLSPRITGNSVQVGDKLYSVTTIRSPIVGGVSYSDIRWTVVDANTGVLVSSGRIDQGDFDYYQGSIAVNESGQAVIGYNRSGFQTGDTNGDGKADGNISFLARTFTLDTFGGLTAFGDEMLLRVSDISDYHCGPRGSPGTCRERWGDYSAVTFDPSDHSKFFAIGEYASEWAIIPDVTTTARAIWHTFIAEIGFVREPIGFVPEPDSVALFGAGLAALLLTRRRREPAV